MSQPLDDSRQSMLFAEASPARTCLWPASARAWLDSGQGYGLSFYELLNQISRDGLSLRMCPGFLAPTKEETLPQSFEGWSNAGIASRGGSLMLNFTEWPNAVAVYSLSQVLETEVAPKYFLSPKACRGILRRAEERGRELPQSLKQALERNVPTALSSKNERIDGDTETFVVSMPLKAKANSSHDESHETYVTHALRSEGADASEDGIGRGTPLVVDRLEHHRFHCLTCGQWFGVNDYESNTVTCPNCGETHINKITDVLDAQAVDVRNLKMQPDGTSGTLQHKKSGGYSLNYQNPVLAFSSKDHGADAGEISPTLRVQNFKDSHISGGGQVAIAFDERNITSRENRSNPQPGDPCHTLHRDPPRITGFGVRRLTPRECERLQGFPDDWTLYDAEGKEISNSARYRMLGNAVCVNVAEWIGKRIMKVANQ